MYPLKKLLRFLTHTSNFISLHKGEEQQKKVLENVTTNTSFRGSSIWILSCAIIIASIGLNVNSTAVIIGAMLISPLMGPIVGAGFALGTYNFALLKKSFKNLAIATFASLVVSFIYFYISPFKEVQSELLARTSPNIYDILIAFFGGLVGAIAITRVEKGNPIPGVAIATALMPPLCTAGYGLSIGNIQYFLGAAYLYIINCFFICIATFLVIKYLGYRPITWVDKKYEKKIRQSLSALIIIMIIPSFYLAYQLLNEKKYTQNVDRFINTEFVKKGFTVIYKKINYKEKPKTIELAFLNKKIDSATLSTLNGILSDFGLNNTRLIVHQDDTDIKSEILKELGKNNNELVQKDLQIKQLQKELSAYKPLDSGLRKEIFILFPHITQIALGQMTQVIADSAEGTEYTRHILIYASKVKTDTQRLKQWLEEKLHIEEITLLPVSE